MIHTSTEDLRARMREYLQSTGDLSHRARPEHPLDDHQRRLLQQARAAGGRVTFTDLPLADLVEAANAAFELQHRGLARTSIRFAGRTVRHPEGVRVELTDAGARCARTNRSAAPGEQGDHVT